MKAIFSRSSCLSRQSIRNYVDGNLSPEERFEVENHLLDCALCRAAVDGYALTREEAPDIHFNATSRKTTRWRKPFLWVCFIAGLAAALGYAQYRRAQQPEALYLHYFAPPANTYLVLSEGQPSSADRAQAMGYYDEGRYAAAIPHFERYVEHGGQDDVLLYYGIAQLCLQQLPEAISTLSTVATRNGEKEVEANWYLALAYLRNGDTEAAKKILRPLLETQGAYRQKAEDLLRDLEQLD